YYKISNISCTTIIKDRLSGLNMYWVFRLHLSTKAIFYFEQIKAMGLPLLLNNVIEYLAANKILRNMSRTEIFQYEERKSMPLLGSNLVYVFSLYLILCLVSTVILLIEYYLLNKLRKMFRDG